MWCLSQAKINWQGCGRKGIWRKNGGWWRWSLISPDRMAPSRIVSVSTSVIFPCTMDHKSTRFLLAPAHPGSPGERGRKMVVCVCVGGGVSVLKMKQKYIIFKVLKVCICAQIYGGLEKSCYSSHKPDLTISVFSDTKTCNSILWQMLSFSTLATHVTKIRPAKSIDFTSVSY